MSRNLARQQARHKQRSRRQRKIPAHLAGRADSASSVTDSTMSLNIITVTLNMDTVSFLGISIVGQVRIRRLLGRIPVGVQLGLQQRG